MKTGSIRMMKLGEQIYRTNIPLGRGRGGPRQESVSDPTNKVKSVGFNFASKNIFRPNRFLCFTLYARLRTMAIISHHDIVKGSGF